MKFTSPNKSQEEQKRMPKLIWKDADKEIYKERLKRNLSVKKNEKGVLHMEDLTSIIQYSSPKKAKSKVFTSKEKWYNSRCHTARKKSFHWLHKYIRTNNLNHKNKYKKANLNYKKVCEESRNKYFEQLDEKISKISDVKEWWKLVKEIKNQDYTVGSSISPDVFREYFQTLLNPDQVPTDISFAPNNVIIEELDRPITIPEILAMLKKTKTNKSPGIDGIPYEYFTNATQEFLEELANVYNKIYDSGNVDKSFDLSIIFPILKKGDKTRPENYRGISFMNCAAKIMMGILTERLTSWVETNNILTEYQAGFRKNYSTADNVYNLASIVNLKMQEKKKVYAFFVDFRAAFDKVPRKLLNFKLRSIGISSKMANFIENVYANTTSVVWTGESFSEPFCTYSGVKQGCLMSPLLFALYLNDLHDHLEGGMYIDDLNIRLLLYADDIVILADDVKVLQRMIYRLELYCETWNMEVNLRKSAIMVFRRGGVLAKSEKWTFKGSAVEIVSEYTYLGVLLTPRLSFKKHLDIRNNSAKNSIMATWRDFFSKNHIPLATKFKLFEAVCRSIQSYAAQIWGYTLFDEVDKLQLFFIKKILKLPSFAPTYCIMLESGMENGHLYTLNLHLRYVLKTLFEYESHRLPNKLSLKVLEKNIFWAKSLKELEECHGIENANTALEHAAWSSRFAELLSKISTNNKHKMWLRAFQSSSRIYKSLDHNIGQHYFNITSARNKIMWIFKSRCGLIALHNNNGNLNICTLCNLNECENMQHFIGRCPILREYRLRFFGKVCMNECEIIDALNGVNDENWENLVNYVTSALSYRKLILNEFM